MAVERYYELKAEPVKPANAELARHVIMGQMIDQSGNQGIAQRPSLRPELLGDQLLREEIMQII